MNSKTIITHPLQNQFENWACKVKKRTELLRDPERFEQIRAILTDRMESYGKPAHYELLNDETLPLLFLQYVEGFPEIPQPSWATDLMIEVEFDASVSLKFSKAFSIQGERAQSLVISFVQLMNCPQEGEISIDPVELFVDGYAELTAEDAQSLAEVLAEAAKEYREITEVRTVRRPADQCAEPEFHGAGGGL